MDPAVLRVLETHSHHIRFIGPFSGDGIIPTLLLSKLMQPGMWS